MKRIILIIGLLVIIQLFTDSLAFTTEDQPNTPQQELIMENMSLNPLAFTENQGQWDDRVQFKANAGGACIWFTEEGVCYQFVRRIAEDESDQDDPFLSPHERFDQEPDSFEQLVLKASFVGANPNPVISGKDMMEYKCNYFIGNDPNEWHTGVPNYQAVYIEEIYSGIDLKYYGNGKQMEYDFIVSPGTDYSQIQIQYEGAKSLSVNSSGELVVETEWGNVAEQKPIVYQMDGNKRQEIEGKYNLTVNNTFSFILNDKYNPNLPLIIDPVLVFSTYLGGSSTEQGSSIAVDASGCAYVTGFTSSTDFPTVNPYQMDKAYGDVFVTKLSSAGDSLIFSTYLGGNSSEDGWGIAVDASGCAYVTGFTSSTDFPTVNPYQTYQGSDDAFVTKLSSFGNDLIYSTYLGGSGLDDGSCIAVDASGCAYITGSTASNDFPIVNPYQTYQGSGLDGFVTKLSSTGNSLTYSTYFGGSGLDIVHCIALDASGCAYVTGRTKSTDFPTVNPYQTYQGSDSDDAFVTKLSSFGNDLIYSTYLGGDSADEGLGIAVDASECAYVTGETRSTDFPTVNPYQTNQGSEDAFVTKLSSFGNGLIYSTYLGGSGWDMVHCIALDASGCAYVTGVTMSTDFPTVNPYQTYQGSSDAFVTKLSSFGNDLIYSTYLGGSNSDGGYAIALDASGYAYVIGDTYSTDFPTVNPYQTYQGSDNVFVTKLSSTFVCVDSDGDGYGDPGHPENECPDDNCPMLYNPDQSDIDADGIGDVCDPDADGDGIDEDGDGSGTAGDNPCTGDNTENCDDNCPDVNNPDQEDQDEDGIGDVCDPDADGDGIGGDGDGSGVPGDNPCTGGNTEDCDDNCPDDDNPGQEDDDSDGVGNACDNCLDINNPGQSDLDEDGAGDACDPDDDGDGIDDDGDGSGTAGDNPCIGGNIVDCDDNCPTINNPNQEDENDNGIGDACEYICGDANSDQVVNISDAVYIINYVFVGGDPPNPMAAGDANCDGVCNVSDAVSIINYVFAGGNEPCDTDGDGEPDC